MGNVWLLFTEIYHVAIDVEMERFRVAPFAKQGQDGLLLLGREQLWAVMIAVVGAVAAQQFLDGSAQGCTVALLHIVEEGGESIRASYRPGGLVGFATVALSGIGKHCNAHAGILGQVEASQVASAAIGQRTVGHEATRKEGRHSGRGQRWI